MTFYLQPVDASELADGHRWMFVVPPDGDMHFVLDRDQPVDFPCDFANKVISLVGTKVAEAV